MGYDGRRSAGPDSQRISSFGRPSCPGGFEVEGGFFLARQAAAQNARPALVPLTPEAEASLAAAGLPLSRLPFRIGRDLRDPSRRSFRWFRERRRADASGPNDVYLREPHAPHRLSRQHLLIALDPETGRFFLEDRGSACGTAVGEVLVGGERRGGRRHLDDGDIIRPGGLHSPFAFRFVLEEHGGARRRLDGR